MSDETLFAWIIVIIAGLMEPTWVYFMQKSDGYRNVKWTICTAVAVMLSIFLMSVAMKTLSPGTTYAVWTGIGVVGAIAVGIIFFDEKISWVRVLCLMSVVTGIIGISVVGDLV